jgi:hypothetical protein
MRWMRWERWQTLPREPPSLPLLLTAGSKMSPPLVCTGSPPGWPLGMSSAADIPICVLLLQGCRQGGARVWR